ncbi:hypothetical protein DFO45_0084 [Azorhizobium sp. AG788]|nr:hypothetical protein DFO45_0084 [Azorhizobium sp. AG788]
MGKSPSIEEKEKEDRKFREYMDKLAAESKAKEAEMLKEITALVAEHYTKSGWKYARFFGDRRSDYQNYAEWSLKSVTNIIHHIGRAITAGKFPSPDIPGSEDAKPETNKEVKDYLPSFIDDINLTLARVVALLDGFLTQFASTSSATQKSIFQDMPLSGGLHLFLAQNGSVYREKQFFTNSFIGSFQIVFEVYMSVEEARAISIQQILKTTQKEIEIINDLIIWIRTEQSKTLKELIKDPAAYKQTKKDFDDMLALEREDRDRLVKEYDKYKDVVDAVHRLVLIDGADPKLALDFDLSTIFDEWEARIATRHIREQLAA